VGRASSSSGKDEKLLMLFPDLTLQRRGVEKARAKSLEKTEYKSLLLRDVALIISYCSFHSS
jgi:hypothetical protein